MTAPDKQIAEACKTSLDWPRIKKKALFGIEIEVENYFANTNFNELLGRYWSVIRDGSLRNRGVEFVSKPLDLDGCLVALEKLYECYNNGDIRFRVSDRCSTHFHINVGNFTWAQAWKLSTIYALAEPSLFSKFAPERLSNHFCTMLSQSTDMLRAYGDDYVNLCKTSIRDVTKKRVKKIPAWDGEVITKAIYSKEKSPRYYPKIMDSNKYHSLNWSRFTDLHTLEIRIFPATENLGQIKEWISCIASMREWAISDDSLADIHKLYAARGVAGILDNLGVEPVRLLDPRDQQSAEHAAMMMCGFDGSVICAE